MEYLDRFLDYISDNSKHITTRVSVVVVSLLLLILIDDVFSFSYNYAINSRVNNARNITELIKDDSLAPGSKEALVRLREEVLAHKTSRDYVAGFMKDLFSADNHKDDIEVTTSGKPARNESWHLISSAGIYLLSILLLVPVILFYSNLDRVMQRIVSALGFTVLVLSIVYLHYKAFELLPDMLFGSWTWNYIANALLQLLSVLSLLCFTGKIEERREKKLAFQKLEKESQL